MLRQEHQPQSCEHKPAPKDLEISAQQCKMLNGTGSALAKDGPPAPGPSQLRLLCSSLGHQCPKSGLFLATWKTGIGSGGCASIHKLFLPVAVFSDNCSHESECKWGALEGSRAQR